MSVYVYTEKLTADKIAEGVEPTVLALVDAPNPAKADKAFLSRNYERHVAKTGEALKLSKQDIPFIEVSDKDEKEDKEG